MTKPSALLPPSSAQHVALQALLGQGQYGVVTRLATEHDLRREFVYALRDHARVALDEAFAPADGSTDGFNLSVTEREMARTVVALRVVTPASVRDIVAMLWIIYGTGWSYGKVWNVLHLAEQRAAAFLSQVDLSGIDSVALDEMFSQGRPVFAGIDLDTQYLFQLEVHEKRTSEAWERSLASMRDRQSLYPSHAVKDAGSGLAKGVRGCWPEVEERDDLFHAVYLLGKVASHLEQRAYASIAKEEEARLHREKLMKFSVDRSARTSASGLYRSARGHADHAIDRYDRFEALRQEARRVLQLCDRGSGRLRRAQEVEETLVRVAEEMRAIGGERIRRAAKYLSNRAAGLGRYLTQLLERLDEVTEAAGGAEIVEAATRAYQASLDVHRRGPRWDRRARRQELRSAGEALVACTERSPERLRRAIGTVFPILATRHRASSAIENLNSVLRPYLVVQKHAEQGFLNLFRFYWNTRTREWGRNKGTSAYQQLTGDEVPDWLTLLGFPPGERRAQKAA